MATGQQNLPRSSSHSHDIARPNGTSAPQQQNGGSSAAQSVARVLTEEQKAKRTERNRRKRQKRQLRRLECAAVEEGEIPQTPLLSCDRGTTSNQTPAPAPAGTIRKPIPLPSSLPKASVNQTQNSKPTPSQPPKQPVNQMQNKRPNLGITAAPKAALAPRPPPGFPKFNDIPIEAQRRVFEMAYRLSEEQDSTIFHINWPCVSRKVKEWIEPLIYETIILPEDFQDGPGRSRLERYERTFKSRSKLFYSQNVRRLYTNNNIYHSSDLELELLSLCDNLTSLECWSDAREELQALLKTKKWPKLESLSVDLDLLPLDENTFHLPLFQNITYLDFCTKKPQLPSWESLVSLQKLTHIRSYMLVETQREDFRLAMDQTYAIASEARKHFPPNLKYFVILIPFDVLYKIASLERKKAADKQRWERMESIRTGQYDSRIILSCSGDWDQWLDCELSDVEGDDIDRVTTYSQLMSVITYQRWPRDYLSRAADDEPTDIWKDVEEKDRKRKNLLSSRGK